MFRTCRVMTFFRFLLADLLFASLAVLHSAEPSKPNIIFILADDLGVGSVSCYGADNYKTPNVGKLASGGIRFTHGYTAPLCGPSRALIMTGRYAFGARETTESRAFTRTLNGTGRCAVCGL